MHIFITRTFMYNKTLKTEQNTKTIKAKDIEKTKEQKLK